MGHLHISYFFLKILFPLTDKRLLYKTFLIDLKVRNLVLSYIQHSMTYFPNVYINYFAIIML